MDYNQSQGSSWRSINAPPTEAGSQSQCTEGNKSSFLALPPYDPSGRHTLVDQSSGPLKDDASGQSMYIDDRQLHSTTPSRHHESEDSAGQWTTPGARWVASPGAVLTITAALSSKEKRKLRNKKASRDFRRRQREKAAWSASRIDDLESQLEEKEKTIISLESQLSQSLEEKDKVSANRDKTEKENEQLRAEIARLKRLNSQPTRRTAGIVTVTERWDLSKYRGKQN
nr:hypothetical protein L203_05583 [Cryptococcus depauperatus CBS 7841]